MSAAMTIITSNLTGKSRSFWWPPCSVAGTLPAAASVDSVTPADPLVPAEARGAAVADPALSAASVAGC